MSAFFTPLLFQVLVYLALAAAAVGTFVYARSTRRRITCRSCGERLETEHDTVRNCPSCGAPLT